MRTKARLPSAYHFLIRNEKQKAMDKTLPIAFITLNSCTGNEQ